MLQIESEESEHDDEDDWSPEIAEVEAVARVEAGAIVADGAGVVVAEDASGLVLATLLVQDMFPLKRYWVPKSIR